MDYNMPRCAQHSDEWPNEKWARKQSRANRETGAERGNQSVDTISGHLSFRQLQLMSPKAPAETHPCRWTYLVFYSCMHRGPADMCPSPTPKVLPMCLKLCRCTDRACSGSVEHLRLISSVPEKVGRRVIF